MSKAQQNLDLVVSNVHRQLLDKQTLIPKKTERGIEIGRYTIVSNDCLKDIYKGDTLVFKDISLNRVAVKVANLLNFGQDTKINELISMDLKFGQSLVDYKMFKDKLSKAHKEQDQFKIDLYLARLIFAKDAAEYYKREANRLAL
jgi:hypothetical protein